MSDTTLDAGQEAIAALIARGYKEIDGVNGIRRGVRVHNRGEQYAKASREGTAVVLAVLEKDPSSWSVSYGRRDIEVVVQRDSTHYRPNDIGQWADYGTCVAKCLGCEFNIPHFCTCEILAGGHR